MHAGTVMCTEVGFGGVRKRGPRLLALMWLHDGQRRAGRQRRVDDHAERHLIAGGHAAPAHALNRGERVAEPQRTRKTRHLRPGSSTLVSSRPVLQRLEQCIAVWRMPALPPATGQAQVPITWDRWQYLCLSA